MSIRADHLRDFVVVPVLDHMAEATGNNRINCPAAIELVLGTVAHESHMGVYLRQHPTGPARGIGQMEQATYDDLWSNYLRTRPELAEAVRRLASVASIKAGIPAFSEVVGNLNFAVAMIRVRYLPAPQVLPQAGDIQALGEYHVKWYNRGGAATASAFVADYKRLVQIDE